MSEYNVELQDGINVGGTSPTGEISITENGKVNVSQYAYADVNVPSVAPTGKITISENGTNIDVANYATADVQVPQPSGKVTITENGTSIDIADYATADVNVPQGVFPTGTKEITENGTSDVTNYASVNVSVPQPTGKMTITENGTNVDIAQYATADVDVQPDYYTKHIPTELSSLEVFTTKTTFYDILAKNDRIIAVNHRGTNNFAIVERATSQVTRLSPCPTGSDATDVPTITDFYKSGEGFCCRSIAETDDYYIIGIRYSGGETTDGTHLYGGIVFVSKSTKTVTKSYWLPYIITRVVYNAELNILAVGLQMDGLRFYSISGYTLTELETFLYDQSSGSPKRGRESQHGCFFTDGYRQYYANVGFGSGVLFYDVTDSSDITEVGEFQLKNYSPFNNSGSSYVHTYTGICKYPYLYMTIAKQDKEQAQYQFDGVLTLDISNIGNPKVSNFEHITQADCQIHNEFGDTKPTEMTNAHGMLYLNYEGGYLAFEIETDGRSTHYCGKYRTTDFIYGINATPESDIFAGISGEEEGDIAHLMETVEWTVFKTLTHVTVSNADRRIDNLAAYTANVTAETGYALSSVTVLMGGVDITSTAYSSGVITIASVTGDISITATATEISVNYWQPSDATINQYQASKPATITVNDDDISLTMPEYNSGFKTTKDIATPTTDLVLTLRADSVTLTQPVTPSKDCFFLVRFMDSSNGTLKDVYFISSNTQKYFEDIDDPDGISVTARISDIAGASKIQVSLRCASNDSTHLPISIAFTNLRIEVE